MCFSCSVTTNDGAVFLPFCWHFTFFLPPSPRDEILVFVFAYNIVCKVIWQTCFNKPANIASRETDRRWNFSSYDPQKKKKETEKKERSSLRSAVKANQVTNHQVIFLTNDYLHASHGRLSTLNQGVSQGDNVASESRLNV